MFPRGSLINRNLLSEEERQDYTQIENPASEEAITINLDPEGKYL